MYDIKTSNDYDLGNKYEIDYKSDYKVDYKPDYKTDYKTEYKAEYRVENDSDSKYLKDYASNEYNVDDPLIVFNTKKVDIGARDSLGYKSSNRGGGDDYDEYRKQLRNKYDN